MFAQSRMSYTVIPLLLHVEMEDAQMQPVAQAFRSGISWCHTVRDFGGQIVPCRVIEASVTTADLSPSGADHQPWFFSGIENPEIKRAICLAAEEEEKLLCWPGGRRMVEGAGTDWDWCG